MTDEYLPYEDLVAKIKACNETQVKIALAAVADYHSPKPFKYNCGGTCKEEGCKGVHYDERKGCQCGSWYPCETMKLLERTLDWL